MVVLDGSDRILLTKRQMQHAGIEKEIILAPLNDRIELWSPMAYEKLVEKEPDDLSDLAEEVLGGLNGEKATDE